MDSRLFRYLRISIYIHYTLYTCPYSSQIWLHVCYNYIQSTAFPCQQYIIIYKRRNTLSCPSTITEKSGLVIGFFFFSRIFVVLHFLFCSSLKFFHSVSCFVRFIFLEIYCSKKKNYNWNLVDIVIIVFHLFLFGVYVYIFCFYRSRAQHRMCDIFKTKK